MRRTLAAVILAGFLFTPTSFAAPTDDWNPIQVIRRAIHRMVRHLSPTPRDGGDQSQPPKP